jgi:hypothetical protein
VEWVRELMLESRQIYDGKFREDRLDRSVFRFSMKESKWREGVRGGGEWVIYKQS